MKPPRIYLSSPHMGADELTLVQEAFATNWIAPLGPHVDKFESEFVETLKAESGKLHAAVAGKRRRISNVSQERTEKTEGTVHTANVCADQTEKSPGSSVPSVSSCANDRVPLYAAALSSGTAALHLALRLVGVRAGDEVFVSTLTFSASVNPIVYEAAKPVFIDSERTSWNMDPARLEEALKARAKQGRLPRAVILVHLYGQCADLDAIAGLCERYGVPLIEDAAEALGAAYYSKQILQEETKRTEEKNSVSFVSSCSSKATAPGTVGRIGIFSFNGNKIITTSGGGMLVSAEKELVDKARFLATQARDPAPHYQHSEIGFNYRLSNVCAAIGRGQLRVLPERVDARRANCAFYQQAFADLAGIEFMPEAPWSRSTRWLTCILVDPKKSGVDREAIRLALEKENIEARPVWKPMHLQPVFAGCECFGGEVAEDLFDRGLCLPSGSNLTEADLRRVAEVVRRCVKT